MATVKAVSKYKRYEDNQSDRGLTKIHPYVPKIYRDEALKHCEELRNKFKEEKAKAHLKKK